MSSTLAVFASIMILNAGQTVPVREYGTATNLEMLAQMTGPVISLKRNSYTDGAVIGTLSINGKVVAYSLEDHALMIPSGTYPLSVYYSNKAQANVLLLHNVPGREYIEIHPGNVKSDAQGCILVGRSHTDKSVVDSRGAMRLLLKLRPSVLIVS